MNKLLFAAPASGSGKTTVTMAVLAALKARGHTVHAFKCGPDYIDPMFHRAALGLPCHNLDLYLTAPDRLKELFARYASGAEVAVAEGVMGFYDGVGGVTAEASAWHVADVLDLPVVLVLRPKGASLSLASVVKGLQTVPEGAPGNGTDSHLNAILLSDCSEMQYHSLRPMLEAETGLPVLGFLPHLEEAALESRHLGLKQAGEVEDLAKTLDLLAETAGRTIDLNALLALGEGPAPEAVAAPAPSSERVRIAVARDEAFAFCYDETLDAFREAGGEPVFFRPLSDEALPEDIGGLYLPGGYPELHARELSENTAMRAAVREAVESGLPTIAECGGFLYLGAELASQDGTCFPMAGVFLGAALPAGKPVRFGYAELVSDKDTLLAPAGQPVRIHNFHYWDTSARGSDYTATKPVNGRTFTTGYGTDTLYAGFPHLYFAGDPEMTGRFIAAARNYQKEH
ncbi:MAG: cobyrinate a,c-diamide synthase [Clostridia bacterium]|nr:cobyrinate a,c-diamide synthase [Clostridia bacterium]